jgi:hypothetical protein
VGWNKLQRKVAKIVIFALEYIIAIFVSFGMMIHQRIFTIARNVICVDEYICYFDYSIKGYKGGNVSL